MRSSSFLPAALLAAALPLRVLFLETRSAMSTLASVVSLGSPGSTEASASLSELLFPRWRLLGGCCELPESVLRWPCEGAPEDSGAVVSPSSPDASRDSAWSWASMADCTLFGSAMSGEEAAAAAARLRLLPPRDALGDAMVLGLWQLLWLCLDLWPWGECCKRTGSRAVKSCFVYGVQCCCGINTVPRSTLEWEGKEGRVDRSSRGRGVVVGWIR